MGWMTRLGSIVASIGTFLLTYNPPGDAETLGQPWTTIGTILAAAAALLLPIGLRRSQATITTKLDKIETQINGQTATTKKKG